MRRAASVLMLAGLLAGCNTTLKVEKPETSTGLYATHSVLAPGDVRVAEKFDPAYTQMVYLKINSDPPNPQFVEFFLTALKDMNTFKTILVKDDLQQIVIERNLGTKVPSVSDLVGLNNLSKEIGQFLIVEPNAVFRSAYTFEGTLRAIDASTGKTVLLIDKTALNVSGLDEPLFHPMLNGFINWTRNQPIVSKVPERDQSTGSTSKP